MAETKKKRGRPRKHSLPSKTAAKGKQSKALGERPLPPPIEPGSSQPSAAPTKSGPEQKGLFGLDSLFNPPHLGTSPDSSTGSSNGSTHPSGEPLSPEQLRILEAVPDTISGEADRVEDFGAGESLPPEPPPAAHVLTPEMMAFVCCVPFAALARITKQEAWKLTDGESGKLGAAWAPVANALIARYLPAFLAEWGLANPELLAAIVVTGVVVAGKSAAAREAASKEHKARVDERAQRPSVPGASAKSGDGVEWAA